MTVVRRPRPRRTAAAAPVGSAPDPAEARARARAVQEQARRFVVRAAEPDDLCAIAALYAPYVVETVTTLELEVPDLDDWARRMAAARARRQPWRVTEDVDVGRVVGYAAAASLAPEPERAETVTTAIYLDRAHTGQGLGRVLYGSLIAAVAQAGFGRAVAGVTLPNPASIALHEHFGFRRVRTFTRVKHKHGAWRDVAWFQRDF